jgi:Tol biopolymer transport system component
MGRLVVLCLSGLLVLAGPVCSQMGGTIVFGVEGEIWSINADTTNLTQLAMGSGPVWSPDGRRIAFLRFSDLKTDLHSEIWIMNADGTDVAPLGPGSRRSGRINRLAWSPDGTRIAFHSSLGEFDSETWSEIWVIGVDGAAARKLVDGYWPAWTPNGSRIPNLAKHVFG